MRGLLVCMWVLGITWLPSAVLAEDAATAPGGSRAPVVLSDRARLLHASSLLVDGHNDLPWELRGRIDQLDISKLQRDKLQTDIPRLRQGGVGAQFWSVWVPVSTAKHGEAQVKIWRRSYDIAPPPLDAADERHPCHDARYAGLAPTVLPGTESLKTTLARVQPYWEDRIAPEILRGKPALPPSDLFSLACTLWEALAGERLFDARSDIEVVRKIRDNDVRPLDEKRPDLPPRLVAAVHRALNADPAARFPSARAMAAELLEVLHASGPWIDADVIVGTTVGQAREAAAQRR